MIKEKNFVSGVIYVHNDENKIEEFLKNVISVFEENFEHSEIICVNDCSDDNSVSIIKKTSEIAKATSISLINLSFFHGLELAMNAGMNFSIGDFVFEFDSCCMDFKPEEIMNIYKKSLTGFDIVSASPNKKEKFTSKLFYSVFDKYSDTPCRMTTERFRVLSRRVINRISSMNKTVPYRKAVYANCGLKTFNYKYDTTVNLNVYDDTKEKKYRKGLAMDSLILFTKLGYKFSKGMTELMMFISIFMLIYSVVIYLGAHPVEGWTTTILFLSVAFFGLFGILTIIVKYLQLLINLVFKRKNYTFENVEKLTNQEILHERFSWIYRLCRR